MSGEDAHLEADYEDRNGDPHGIGSPDWREDERDEPGWELPEELEPECDSCGAPAGVQCYEDCPYQMQGEP